MFHEYHSIFLGGLEACPNLRPKALLLYHIVALLPPRARPCFCGNIGIHWLLLQTVAKRLQLGANAEEIRWQRKMSGCS